MAREDLDIETGEHDRFPMTDGPGNPSPLTSLALPPICFAEEGPKIDLRRFVTMMLEV